MFYINVNFPRSRPPAHSTSSPCGAVSPILHTLCLCSLSGARWVGSRGGAAWRAQAGPPSGPTPGRPPRFHLHAPSWWGALGRWGGGARGSIWGPTPAQGLRVSLSLRLPWGHRWGPWSTMRSTGLRPLPAATLLGSQLRPRASPAMGGRHWRKDGQSDPHSQEPSGGVTPLGPPARSHLPASYHPPPASAAHTCRVCGASPGA